jgi:hypothetical protein
MAVGTVLVTTPATSGRGVVIGAQSAFGDAAKAGPLTWMVPRTLSAAPTGGTVASTTPIDNTHAPKRSRNLRRLTAMLYASSPDPNEKLPGTPRGPQLAEPL